MNSTDCVRVGAAVALSLVLGACGGSSGTSLFGGTGGTGGGGGGGGGGTVTTEPRLIQQLNDPGTSIFDLTVAGGAGIAVFVSDAEIAGNMTGGEQIFAMNLATSTLTRVTTVDASAAVEFADFDITDSGDQVVFISNADLEAGMNPGLLPQVFIANTDGSGITQVTALAAGFAADPQISGTGGTIVFTSQEDLDVGMNPMNFSQIFSILPDGTGVTQVTTGQQLPTNLAFSDDGRVVAFESVADPFGTNADGSQEVYVINVDGTGHMQLTAAAGNSYTPRISDDGAWIAIASRADLVAGQNADGGLEVFVVSSDGTTTMQVTQTDQDSGAFGSGTPGSLDISGSGTIVAFASSANLTGDNANMTNTLFFAFRDGTGVGQYLRNGTVNANESGRTADNPHLTNDGNGLLFDSSLNFSIDSSGTGEKLYTTIRQ